MKTPRTVSCAIRSAVKKREDSHASLDAEIQGQLCHLYLVADGHGGAGAARLCAAKLLAMIAAEAQSVSQGELERACTASFVRLHDLLLSDEAVGASGCTCTVVAVVAGTGQLTCANVGDSVRALREPH